MTPETIIREAQADGVRLALSPSGTIKTTGGCAAVNRWVALIREHKAGLVEVLRGDSAPMTAEQERAIRDWLGMIDAGGSSPGYSSDQTAVDELVDKARHDADARDYFVGRAQAELGLKNPDLIRR